MRLAGIQCGVTVLCLLLGMGVMYPPCLHAQATDGRIDPKAFGAAGNGTADDTAAFQTAIQNCVYNKVHAKPIYVSPGVYRFTKTIVFAGLEDLTFDGQGSVFVWDGDTGSPLILVEDVRDSVFRNFEIVSGPTHPLAAGIRSQAGVGHGVTPTTNQFQRVIMDGVNRGGLGKGFQFALGPGGDRNNDLNSFIDCRVSNYTTAGWSFEHSQSVAHSLVRPGVNGGGYGQYGITTALGTTHNGGSFSIENGAGGGNAIADIYLGGANRVIRIAGFDSEGSSSFLQCAALGSANYPVIITGVRFAGNKINPQGDAIVYTFPGPLEVAYSVFSHAPRPIHIVLKSPTGVELYNIHDNAFSDVGSVQNDVVVCDGCSPETKAAQVKNLYRTQQDKPAFRRQ